ncbi:hypothetical protein AIOL_003592 [Candidatus Rhodobacter oscarellae]|uniref:Uncharacterized protein n=1 Tax=Candidatus Rhodobacter oscarellae TaxID=1675527 RepID=A0A0J9EAE6_9RHOB|nr:hypothetical protein [Candidatus Rhodobacter lobularis]KMW58614.1 hypothetical protein AIOL_003592 [Candidatus Rhodobacter lobularis]
MNDEETLRQAELRHVENATHWAGIIDRAESEARAVSPPRPCDYKRWTEAIARACGKDAVWLGSYWIIFGNNAEGLMAYTAMVARPVWPEEHQHLVEFSLRFLEADVMLFRSGYAKKNLLQRSRQARLSDDHKARLRQLVRRTLLQGTGMDEFREYCRMAVKLSPLGFEGELKEWAAQAYLTTEIPGIELIKIITQLDEKACERWVTRTRNRGARYYAVRSDLSLPLVKVADLPVENKLWRSAWLMLQHLRRCGVIAEEAE